MTMSTLLMEVEQIEAGTTVGAVPRQYLRYDSSTHKKAWLMQSTGPVVSVQVGPRTKPRLSKKSFMRFAIILSE